MTMYYPTYHQQGDENGIDIDSLRRTLLLCIGLSTLLHLQYESEGHQDEHVYKLFEVKMHEMEQLLSSSLHVRMLEDMPF